MEKQQKTLQRRGLFGIRSEDAQRILSERDASAQAASDEVRSADERASASEARVAALEAQLAEVAGTRDASSDLTPSTTDLQPLLLAWRDEMTSVMHATQEAGSRIIDRGRTDAGHLLEESERRRSEIEAEREQLTGWIAQLRQSSPSLLEGIADMVGALNRAISAMNEADQAVARMFGRMGDAEALIQRNQRLLSEASVPETAKAEVLVELAPQPPRQDSAANGNGLSAPEPPIDVSDRVPWALREGGESNGSPTESRAAGPLADPRINR
jgi:predicted  nucleic acid-binding Zn-ribbon protein